MQSARFPLLAALLLGLLVAFNPCQLAINLSALTYLHKDGNGKKANILHGTLYALGRMATYTVMGWVMAFGIRQSQNIDSVKNALSKTEDFLPYILAAVGIILIVKAIIPHRHRHGDKCHNSGRIIRSNGPAGPFILGAALAFAFCPESALFYFGMLIPMSASTDGGWAMPLTFSLAAAIPVVLLSVLINTAIQAVHRFEATMSNIQKWLNIATGLIFILIAVII